MSINQYFTGRIIVYNYYPLGSATNGRSYAYPKNIINDDGTLEFLTPDDFPDDGALQIDYRGGYTSDDANEQYGDIFVIDIGDLRENDKYGETSKNKYYVRYNPDLADQGKGDAIFWSMAQDDFRQIVTTSTPIDVIRQRRRIKISEKYYTREVMVQIGEKLYGPFDRSRTNVEDEYILDALSENKYSIGVFDTNNLQDYITEIGDEKENYIASFISDADGNLMNLADSSMDFASTNVLLDNLATIISYNVDSIEGVTRKQVQDIKTVINEAYKTNQSVFLSEYRRDKILELVESYDNMELIKEEVLKKLINKDSYALEALNYLAKYKQELFKNVPDVQSAVTSADTNIYNDEKITAYEETIELIKLEKENYKNEIEELKAQLNNREAIPDGTMTKEELAQYKAEIEELNRQKDEVKKQYNEWVVFKKEVEDELKESLTQYSSQAKMLVKATDNQLLQEVMERLNEHEDPIVEHDEEMIRHYLSADEIIDRLYEYILNKTSRDMTREEITNILICISNGFITTFAGQPGTGKTSLCTIIANALGLDGNDRRFIQIAVERGWTSNKDYIGYYNPLSRQFEKSNNEMFDAIRLLDYETRNKYFDAPYLVLLDEANLSPIEHYWAGFNRICDLNNNSKRSISLGGDYDWLVSPNMRFLATINNDHTTEELSPRFLDRSWIIFLKPLSMDFSYQKEEISNYESFVSMDNLREFFTPSEGDDLKEVIKEKWKRINNAFIENGLSISPRNLNMIRDYCLVGQKTMSAMTALDYAVAQKLLPTINGSGEKYKNLVQTLKGEFEGSMPNSFRLIKIIEENAEENYGNYQLM